MWELTHRELFVGLWRYLALLGSAADLFTAGKSHECGRDYAPTIWSSLVKWKKQHRVLKTGGSSATYGLPLPVLSTKCGIKQS